MFWSKQSSSPNQPEPQEIIGFMISQGQEPDAKCEELEIAVPFRKMTRSLARKSEFSFE